MSDRHTLKYVYVDTRNKKTTDAMNKITVSVPHGLNQCSRVALKAFTIANTFPNMHQTKVQWIEWIQVGPNQDVTAWKPYMFQIDFENLEGSEQYLDNEALTIELQRKFANGGGQLVKRFEIDAEGNIDYTTYVPTNKTTTLESPTALTIAIALVANTFSIEGKTDAGHRMIGLFTSQNSLWTKMGFALGCNWVFLSHFHRTLLQTRLWFVWIRRRLSCL